MLFFPELFFLLEEELLFADDFFPAEELAEVEEDFFVPEELVEEEALEEEELLAEGIFFTLPGARPAFCSFSA